MPLFLFIINFLAHDHYINCNFYYILDFEFIIIKYFVLQSFIYYKVYSINKQIRENEKRKK
jgi:hypothetical protein